MSFAQWPEHTVESKTFFTKQNRLRFQHMVDFRGKRGKIETKSGRYKPLHVHVHARHALYIDWYCTGHRAEIEDLLRFCTHLGKKSSQGWGEVLRWEIVDWPEAWYLNGPGGKLMRAVPTRGPGYLYGIRPSYWLPKHQFTCRMPEVQRGEANRG
jgi:CRISPR type IV-associated protein Csf3